MPSQGMLKQSSPEDPVLKPLSLAQILLYSSGNLGANLVYAFANFAFPLYLRGFAVPNILVGFLAQERSFVGSLVQPLIGALSDRVPPNPLGRRRPFLLVGVPLTAISLLLLSSYPPIWAVVAIMSFFALFIAVSADPYMALMPDISPPEQRGRIGGVMVVFSMMGQVAVIGLSFLLWESHQRELFWLIAAGMVAAFGITFAGVREPPMARGEGRKRGSSRHDAMPYIRDLMSQREVLKYLSSTFFFWMGNGGVSPFITRFGVDVLGAEESQSFLLVLPVLVGTALFSVPAGLLTEHFGKKRVLKAGMFAFGALVLLGSWLVRDIPQAWVMLAMVGIANAATTALVFPMLADLMPRGRTGEFTGLGSMVWSVAQTLGALGAGALADGTGSLRASFAFGGVCMLVGSQILVSVRQPDRGSAPAPTMEDSR